MKQHDQFKYTPSVFIFPLLMVMTIWVVFWVERKFGFNFMYSGIYPQHFSGLIGVVFSPFIHGDIEHLYHNTIPLFVLTAALVYFYRSIALKVLFYGVLLSGFLTWCIGRPSYHIGASGLIYVLVSFTFFKGVFSKHFRLVALSLLVIFLYGSMIWYVFPVEEGISWEGHLSGLIAGLLFAFVFRKTIPKPKRYDWEQDDYNEGDDAFLKHFDEDGNFIELPSEDDDEQMPYNYVYKKEEED